MVTERKPEAVKLAKQVVEGSIVQQAAERLIYQIVEVCAEHERSAVEVMRKQCDEMAAALKEVCDFSNDPAVIRISRAALSRYRTGAT